MRCIDRPEGAVFANILSRYWWMTLLRGVIWIAFGIMLFTQPGVSLATLMLLFGAFVLADGIGTVITAFGGRGEHENWWVLLLAGLAGIGIGLLTFYNPAITALTLQLLIAMWAVSTGLLQIVAAIRLRKEIQGEFWLVAAGLLSVAFGVLLVARPVAGALAVLWFIGGYAVVFGVALIALALRVRGFAKRAGAAIRSQGRAA
jgi:uncharacterized membrane protein HdeD (DUF308 family)